MTTYTVDVSHHDWHRANGRIDWSDVARSGIGVACIRATYGDPRGANWATEHFGDMARGAAQAGLVVGAYHNLIRGSQASINRQVDWLRSEMDAHGATWAMLDVERYEELLARGLEPRIRDVRAFCARWKDVDRRALLVYLPRWVHGYLGSPDLKSLACPLVSSDYGSNASGAFASRYAERGGDSGRGWDAYGGVTPTLWQFGSKLSVNGLSGSTDVNAFRESRTKLRNLLNPEDDMPTASEVAAEVVKQLDTAPIRNGRTVGGTLDALAGLAHATRADVAALREQSPLDAQRVANLVIAGLPALTPQAIAERIVSVLPAELAEQVVSELAARLAAST